MFDQIILDISTSPEAIVTIIGIIIAFGIGIWVAYYSPQAIQSKIENKKYLIEKRKEHYLRLDQEIFQPLSNSLFLRRDGLSTSELDLLRIEFLPIISNQYEKGICHLNSDIPNFHNDFKKLRDDVEKYNLSLEIVYEKLDFIIRTEFDGIIELNNIYSYEQDFYIIAINPVKEVILVLFSRYLGSVENLSHR